MKCDHCPLREEQRPCKAEVTGHARYCELVDPSHPMYEPAYIPLLLSYQSPHQEVPLPAARPYPGLANQAWNLTRAVGRAGVAFLRTGHLRATDEQREARLAICRQCDRYDAEQVRCRECGCYLPEKTSWISESCPLTPPRWGPILPEAVESGGCRCGG